MGRWKEEEGGETETYLLGENLVGKARECTCGG